MPDNSAITKRVSRKPLKSRSGYPYHEAVLTPEDFDITKTWYITFYAWDVGKEQLTRKRILKDELNAIPSLDLRKQYAMNAVRSINNYLREDYHLNSTKVPVVVGIDFRAFSFLNAIKFAINYKRDVESIKKSSIAKYESVLTVIDDFLKHMRLESDYPLRKVNAQFISQFFEYLKSERKVANKTHNDRRGFFHAMFQVLMKKSSQTLFGGVNPASEVRVLQTQTKKHAAFSDQQLQSLIELARKKKDFHVVFYIQLFYYTLARPDEIRKLKVGNLDLTRRRILFKAEDAKTSIEGYVGINDRLYQLLVESGVTKYPGHYYIFSNELISKRNLLEYGHSDHRKNGGRVDERSFEPGLTPVGKNYFYDLIAGYLTELNLYAVNPNFTPYGIKHTGAIGLYLATKDPRVVQAQCRHQKLETTLNYLRDLGVFIDFEQINKWNGPL